MSNLKEILQVAGTLERAETMAREMTTKDQQFQLDLQLVLSARGKITEAKDLIEKLAREHPEDDRIAFNRGWYQLHDGDLPGGLASLARGRKVGVFGSPMPMEKPRWDGSDPPNKTILLHGEGGLGDEIVSVRFAAELAARGAKVLVACQPGLRSLFDRVPGVWKTVSHAGLKPEMYDAWVPAMSAVLILGHTYETLPPAPYIKAQPDLVKKWSEIVTAPTGVLKIGIRWSGNPEFEHEQFRRFPVLPLFDLASLHGVKLFSFQRDSDWKRLPHNITDLGDKLATWEDTAAAIANLDLVISSCTSVAHLAAAMGKETWVLVPLMPYYIWAQPGERSAWHPTARLFRQTVEGDWSVPFKQLRRALLDKLAHNNMMKTPMSAPAVKPRKTLHFMAGLPRAGSTMLISLLAQNPDVWGAPVSGLCGIVNGININWQKIEFHQEAPNQTAKFNTLRAALDHYYDHVDRPVIVDKERNWIRLIPLLERVLERPVRMIVPVRPVTEILASFETLRQKDPLNLTTVDEELGPRSTLATRCQYFMDDNGVVGSCYNYTKDAVVSGYRDRLLFVDYNKFVQDPVGGLKRIYDFLDLPLFRHDFQKIPQLTAPNDRVWNYPGLHTIRPELARRSVDPITILGPELTARWSRVEPWEQWT